MDPSNECVFNKRGHWFIGTVNKVWQGRDPMAPNGGNRALYRVTAALT